MISFGIVLHDQHGKTGIEVTAEEFNGKLACLQERRKDCRKNTTVLRIRIEQQKREIDHFHHELLQAAERF
ncbi:hypothetical protein HH214_08905 [Mucilaginibacter robiniae]|uniref:Uncharacterized protein n=2 Tax=Mucilaginibacter robiniae TaxID=2728022 RepID=A0A7L5E0U2_9SPHI|nr:hypothetical protein HH214_08905 [Mucilaginibacter robiniae]